MAKDSRNNSFDVLSPKSSILSKSGNISLVNIVSPISIKVGDIITYILQIIVPVGNIISNVQLIDTFQSDKQEFIRNSILKNGLYMENQPIPINGILTFPNLLSIDASKEEITETYSFKVRVTDATINNNFFDIQQNNSQLKWEDASGVPGTPINSISRVYVNLPNIQLSLFQSNLTKGIEYTNKSIKIIGDDVLAYEIQLVNSGKSDAYNIVVNDDIANDFIVDSKSLKATKGNGNFIENTLTWNINNMEVGEVVSIHFNVTASNNVPVTLDIPNKASVTFNSNDNNFGKSFDPIESNILVANLNNLEFNVMSSTNIVTEQQEFLYTLIINLYKGSILNNVLVYDILPKSIMYVGNAYKQINNLSSEAVNPKVESVTGGGQKVIFPQPIIGIDNSIDASNEAVQIKYIFTAKVTSVSNVPPYIEQQKNEGIIEWTAVTTGSTIQKMSQSVSINVQVSNIDIMVEQKNLTTNGKYTTETISLSQGDIIAYKVTVNSLGTAPVYNLKVQDTMPNYLIFQDTLNAPSKGTVIKPTKPENGLLIWSIPNLQSGEVATYEFSAQVKSQQTLGEIINNFADIEYFTTENSLGYYSKISNVLDAVIKGLLLNITATPNNVVVGDDVEYNVEITVPKGNIIKSLRVMEILDKGQEFKTGTWISSLGGAVTPPVVTNSGTHIEYVEFNLPSSTPVDSNLIITYTFKSKVISGSQNSVNKQTQTSINNITWTNEVDAREVNPIVNSTQIIVSRPYLIVSKMQKNITKGDADFTKLPLKNVTVGDEIEYQLYITNSVGAARANDIVIKDQLPSDLEFIPRGDSTANPSGLVTMNIPFISETGLVHKSIFATVKNTFNNNSENVNSFTTTYKGATTNPDVVLGPIDSNKIGIGYVPPQLNAYTTKAAVFVGDTVTYKFVVTILQGNIAYNVQPSFILPSEQQYVENSLTSVGGVTIGANTTTLTFPNEGTIDASTMDKTITYTFQAEVLSTPNDSPNNQQGTGTIQWNLSNTGTPGTTQSMNTSVYVMKTKVVFNKLQSLGATNYVKNNLKLNVGQRIYYKLEINNPSSVPIYNIEVRDVTPSGVTIQSLDFIDKMEKLTLRNNILGANNLNFNISSLLAGESITVAYGAMLVGPAIIGTTVGSAATITYNGNENTLNVTYGSINSNNLTISIPESNVEFIKTASNNKVLLGDDNEYNLDLRIPKGAVLYNVEVTDTLPQEIRFSGQSYLNDTYVWVKEEGNTLKFPVTSEINTSSGAILWKYMLTARLVNNMNDPNFSKKELQNNAAVSWQTSKSGGTTLNIPTQLTIEGERTIVEAYQLQRNVTIGEEFDIVDINANAGDILEFKMIIKNESDTTAHSIRVLYYTDDNYQYVSTTSVNMGTINYVNSLKYLIWNIETITPLQEAIATFQVKVLQTIPAGSVISQDYTLLYSSTTNNIVQLGDRSNNLIQRFSDISINVSSEKPSYTVGESAIYNVVVNVPNGATFYNLQVKDIIPIGEKFVSSTLNGTVILPQINGQLITFPVIKSNNKVLNNGVLKDKQNNINMLQKANVDEIYNYKIETLVETASVVDGKPGEQINSATITWSEDENDRFLKGPISNSVSVVAMENLLTVKKSQRKNDIDQFTEDKISTFSGEEIQYKIVVENIGKNTAYNVKIEDKLNNILIFNKIDFITVGKANLVGNNILMWSDIPQISPGEVQTIIYSVKVKALQQQTISNMAMPIYALSSTGIELDGTESNEVFINVDVLSELNDFIPDRNSYVSNTEALSYGVVGCKGKIGYILTNNNLNSSSFLLNIDPIPLDYNLYINGMFIQEVLSNTPYHSIPEQLSNVNYADKNKIELVYYIPQNYNLVSNKIKFNISSTNKVTNNDNKSVTIKSEIYVGKVTVEISNTIKDYPDNPNMIAIKNNIILNVTKGIKIYDVQLETFYPPSYIFEKAYKDSVEINVISLNGHIIYPVINKIDSSFNETKIEYSYEVLQYKKTPLSIGSLEKRYALVFLRTAKDIVDKCVITCNKLNEYNRESIECIYAHKIYGRCISYYSYKNILIPPVDGYFFDKVIFENPKIIQESLFILPSTSDKEFSTIKYTFNIPYKLIYQGCGCLEQGQCNQIKTIEMDKILEEKNLAVVLYTPRYNEKYDIIAEVRLESIVYNNSKTEFCVCLGVITSALSKYMGLIENNGECMEGYCCPNCKITNRINKLD